MSITREAIAACIAQHMSIPATAKALGVTEWAARRAAKAYGLRWPNSRRPCASRHPESARRLIGGRIRCGACYDTTARRLETRRSDAKAAATRAKQRAAPAVTRDDVRDVHHQLDEAIARESWSPDLMPWERHPVEWDCVRERA